MSSVKITSNKAQVLSATHEKITQALEMCGLLAEGYAQLNCPVDTGTLRNSISHKVLDNECYIGTNVEYAPYVELGTGSYYPGGSGIVGMKARPYLKPALDEHRDEYKQVIEDTLKN